MVTNYVEDYDGKKNDDAAEAVTFEPTFEDTSSKRVDTINAVEDKAVKTAANKSAKKKS